MIIDGHGHIGTYSKFYPLKIRTVEQTIDAMDAAGVEKMVVSHLESFSYDAPEGNKRLKEDIARYPGRFIPFFNVHPRYERQAADEIAEYAGGLGWRGLKLHPQYQMYSANCIEVKRLIERAAKYNCAVLYHSGDSFVGAWCSPAMIADVAKDFPRTTVIMGHMGVSDWPGAIEEAREHKNIILDATSCIINYGVLEYAVKQIGRERVIWGSDFPFYPHQLGLSKIIDSELDAASKEFVLGRNIERIMKHADN